ncbi:MAG: hypothetical protein KAY32_06350 [Candidatus Eisenbacteria sp.]|nr:hypothetical protein [Candidatus Eisenbacteria bacterium]
MAIPIPSNTGETRSVKGSQEVVSEGVEICRREQVDRRSQPTPMLSRYTIFGRRRSYRRLHDLSKPSYIDLPHGVYLYALLLMIVLISVDTFSTLFIISHGGTEGNPLMRWFLDRGSGWFILAKLGTALVGFVLLGVHEYVLPARRVVGMVILAYFALAIYHLFLLTKFLY